MSLNVASETLEKYLAPVFFKELVAKENEMDIFKKLNTPPDEVRAAIRIYNMKPKNDTNFANPLDIIYTIAEGTFLRMLKRLGGQGKGFDRNFIKGIKYFENENLAKRFNESKPAFQIMTREGRRMQMKTMSVWQIPKTRSL